MNEYKIEFRWHWAWQAAEEADWLARMANEGWLFAGWRMPNRYYFRRADPQMQFDYLVERRWVFFAPSPGREEAFLNEKAAEGWELVQPAPAGWFVFCRPRPDPGGCDGGGLGGANVGK